MTRLHFKFLKKPKFQNSWSENFESSKAYMQRYYSARPHKPACYIWGTGSLKLLATIFWPFGLNESIGCKFRELNTDPFLQIWIAPRLRKWFKFSILPVEKLPKKFSNFLKNCETVESFLKGSLYAFACDLTFVFTWWKRWFNRPRK